MKFSIILICFVPKVVKHTVKILLRKRRLDFLVFFYGPKELQITVYSDHVHVYLCDTVLKFCTIQYFFKTHFKLVLNENFNLN